MSLISSNHLSIGRTNLIRQSVKSAWYEAIAYDKKFSALPAWNAISVYIKELRKAINHE